MSNTYYSEAEADLKKWQMEMLRNPGFLNSISKRIQTKINNWIPEKVHRVVTTTMKQMIKAVLFTAKYSTAKATTDVSFEQSERRVMERIEFYRNTAAVEGGITGAGGILLGLADFPILLSLKLKLLFDVASLYGFDVNNYKERVYILHIFELTFSSHVHRKKIYLKLADWDHYSESLPEDINQFDWRPFQQEYRDYIDLAKMAQLVPIIGAPVGFIANYGLVKKLGITAMNAYRMRLFKNGESRLLETDGSHH